MCVCEMKVCVGEVGEEQRKTGVKKRGAGGGRGTSACVGFTASVSRANEGLASFNGGVLV